MLTAGDFNLTCANYELTTLGNKTENITGVSLRMSLVLTSREVTLKFN